MTLAPRQGFPGCDPSGCEGRAAAPYPAQRRELSLRRPTNPYASRGRRAAVNQDQRAPFVRALQRARTAAYAPGEYVEQEGFMRAAEILALARRAGISAGISVLDLCCVVARPGRFITREPACTYLGLALSSSAIEIARENASDLPCRFEVA